MEISYPRISAIVPVFNKAPYIIESIRSLQAQNYAELEILVVDDGSTDDSFLVMESLSSYFPMLSIQIFKKPNGGASDARNFAIQRASGQYIVNMDADDIMQPGFLFQATELIVKGDADVVYSDLELFGDREGEWVPHPFDPYFIRYDNCVPSLAVFPKELWEKVGGYNVALPFSEDWNFFVALTRFTQKFKKLPWKAFRYRQTGTGLYQNFIRDAWEWGTPLLMCAQDDLYAVDEILGGCEKLKGMPERWVYKFQKFCELHSSNWLPHFFVGLVQEGRNRIPETVACYQKAIEVSGLNAWLPLLKLGMLVKATDPGVSIEAFHRVRILRPDMGRILNQEIEQLARSRS